MQEWYGFVIMNKVYEFGKIFSSYLDLNFLTVSSTTITVYYWFTSRDVSSDFIQKLKMTSSRAH
jgi:hypothetical protein